MSCHIITLVPNRPNRIVAVVLLLLQAVMLTFVPASRAAAVTPVGMDLCRAAAAMPATPDAPAAPHAAHACGDCCTAHSGPVPAGTAAPACLLAQPAPAPAAGASPARPRSAPVLPPACGPPATA